MKSKHKKRREPLFRVKPLDDGSGDQAIDPPMPSKSTYQNWFEAAAKHPYTWKIQADGLMRSASILLTQAQEDIKQVWDSADIHAEPPVLGSYVLLAGLALENLLKGILVMRHQQLDIKDFMDEIKGHDLNTLARSVGLHFDHRTSFLLEKITAYIIWAGKYPGPLSVNEFLPCDYPDRGWGPIGTFSLSDSAKIQRVFQLLLLEFESRSIDVEMGPVTRRQQCQKP